MGFLSKIINTPLSAVLRFFADIFGGSFAASVFMFTLLINVILIPLSIKSQKASVQQLRIKPKMDDIKKRYGDDRQKLAEAQQKLYRDENISMSGGCLPMFIRLALMLCIYYLIMSPLTFLEKVDSDKISTVTTTISAAVEDLSDKDKTEYKDFTETWGKKGGYKELPLIKVLDEHFDEIAKIVPAKEYKKIESDLKEIKKAHDNSDIRYNLGSIDLTEKPNFDINIIAKYQTIWLIPIFAFLAQMLTSIISMFINKKNNPDAPTMAGMMLTMPLISLFLGFTFPGGVGFYWICSSLIGGLIQSAVQLYYGPAKMLANQRIKELKARADFEKKQIEKSEQAATEPESDNK